MNAEQKEALRAFDNAMGGSLNVGKEEKEKLKEDKDKKKKGLFDKIKDSFDN